MVSHHDSLGMAGRFAGSVAAKARSPAPVRAWLWCIAGLIFAMVVVGGATRLTQSGLSITEWKPIVGIIPPLSAEAWQSAFDKYKAIPQYAQLFPDMDLAGFKAIFYWEWAHRLLGRIIGFAFALPLVVFWLRGRLAPALKPRLIVLLALGGLQGLIGWWMVKSGLSERTSVSQYRLAVHLVTASIAFAYAIWLAEGLRTTRERRIGEAQRIRGTSTLIVGCIFVQLGLGALVAGLHAGLVYNTWPLIDGRFVPPFADLLSQHPAWRNLFENVLTVQFDHRMMAYAILLVALVHAADAWSAAPGSPTARRALLLAGVVLAQAALGVTTLLLVVPLWAALVHQAMAMIVLATAMVHRRRLSPQDRYSPLALRA